VVDGQCGGGDLDFFRFPAKKGQRLVLEVESARIGSAVLPMLRLTDSQRRLLGVDDRQALQGDARLVFSAPADGDYVVELADTRYRAGTPSHYRLKIADYDVVDEIFPLGGQRGMPTEFTLRGGSLATEARLVRPLADPLFRHAMLFPFDPPLRAGAPTPRLAVGEHPERNWIKNAGRDPRALDLLPPVTINSRLEKPGDVDRFQFPVEPGQRFRIAVEAEPFGSRLDGVLRVTDQSERQLALADDVALPSPAPGLPPTQSADPSLDLTVPAGATLAIVELRDQRNRGGVNFVYRLTVEPAVPDFTLQVAASELNVPRGGTALLPITVARRGYTGPIVLTASGLPPGWTTAGGQVPANAATATLSVSAPAGAMPLAAPATLRIEGRAREPGLAVVRPAEVNVPLTREINSPGALLPLHGVALETTTVEPFQVTGPAQAEAIIGYPVTIPIRLGRSMDQAMLAIQVSGRDVQTAPGQATPPERWTIPAPPAATGDSVPLTVTPGATLADGLHDLIVEGRARVGNADRTVAGPIVPIRMKRPFTVAPVSAGWAIAPGAAVAFPVKLQREAPFQEAVQLRLEGLPAGVVLAKPLAPLPGTAGDFAIELKADAKAAPANGELTLTATTTLGGRAYTHPPVKIPLAVKAQ
jgi:hypothetical protein